MSDEQLQLFDVPEHPARARGGLASSLGHATLRHDYAVLLAIIAMIAASIVFASGVERGKRLANAQPRSPLSIAHTVSIPEAVTEPRRSSVAVPTTAPAAAASPARAAPSKPATTPQKPSKLASGESRFAVQVVSYSQAKFAQQELQQLQRQGEKAFLLKRQGKTTLLVGPFPTKENAASKLSGLRPRYRDCFIRTL